MIACTEQHMPEHAHGAAREGQKSIEKEAQL
jgi:hypothetical protein